MRQAKRSERQRPIKFEFTESGLYFLTGCQTVIKNKLLVIVVDILHRNQRPVDIELAKYKIVKIASNGHFCDS